MWPEPDLGDMGSKPSQTNTNTKGLNYRIYLNKRPTSN